MNNASLIERYLDGENTSGRSGNIFYEGNCIYSYGYHYLLGEKKGLNIFINSHRYSASTNNHIISLYRIAKNRGFNVIYINGLTKLYNASYNCNADCVDKYYTEYCINKIGELTETWVKNILYDARKDGKGLKRRGELGVSELENNITGVMIYFETYYMFEDVIKRIVKSVDESLKETNTIIQDIIWSNLLSSIDLLKQYKQ